MTDARALFNPFDPAVQADPYPSFALLRDLAPVLDTPLGVTVFSRYAEAAAILRDPKFSTSSSWGSPNRPGPGQLAKSLGLTRLAGLAETLLLFLDAPDHTRIRGLVNKAFTPRTVESMRPRIEQIVTELLDVAAERGEIDLIPDLAYPLPVAVICELLGVPDGDHERFRGWSKTLAGMIDPIGDASSLASAEAAAAAFTDYFAELVAERRASSGADLLSGLIAAEEAGEGLSFDELLSLAILLLVAGHETTMNLIGNGVLALLRHPGELGRLRADPSLVRNAVDELLRYDPPVQFTARTATTDVVVGGRRLRRGDSAIVVIGSANRDPLQFPDPDRLDLARSEANRHLAFSAGMHYCLGAALARAEAQVAIGSLIERFPGLVQAGTERRRPNINLRGLESLPLQLSMKA